MILSDPQALLDPTSSNADGAVAWPGSGHLAGLVKDELRFMTSALAGHATACESSHQVLCLRLATACAAHANCMLSKGDIRTNWLVVWSRARFRTAHCCARYAFSAASRGVLAGSRQMLPMT